MTSGASHSSTAPPLYKEVMQLRERERGRRERRGRSAGWTEPTHCLPLEARELTGARKMMLQHPGQGSAVEVSATAIVPCLSPTMTFAFEDFTNLTPLVKEELRFTIQNKRIRAPCTLDSVVVAERPIEMTMSKSEFVPQEDDRKKRRRERNKVAAAKCRNKKKERTESLQKESEKLESINAELKAQIEELKNEKQHLIYMLNLHRPTCIVRAQNGRTPEDEHKLFIQQIKESTLHNLVTEGVN
ncbi:LOW QUALITY PROTEIN: cyclic AMP-dependent transcription factor ATF-3 [Mantella aurantiaca]